MQNSSQQSATGPQSGETSDKLRDVVGNGSIARAGVSEFIQLTGNLLWGVIGLLILFWGIRIAWRITAGRQFEIYGPFADSPPASS